MESFVSFGSWLKRRRKALDLTQKDLADRVGCSVAAIQKIEREERRPSRQIARLIAEALEVPEEQVPLFMKIARGERQPEALPALAMPEQPLLTVAVSPGGEEPSPLDAASAPSAIPPPRRHLPAPPNPLVGREVELAEITRLLQDPHCRLLTLTGEGGIGKTRLSLEIAHQAARLDPPWQQKQLSGGVYFVSLSPVSDPAELLPTLADALGYTFSGGGSPFSQLSAYLSSQRLLLVLDNLDHLISEARLLADIIAQAPGVRLLVTSRERLKLQGEWVFELSGLPYPDPEQAAAGSRGEGRPPDLERLQRYSAVALFLQCARRRQVHFTVTPENEQAILRICSLVEGMPLGIELAAAWLPTLSVEEICREIERDLKFLSAPTRDLPERHRSIQAVFDHSWEMLTPEAREVLRRLSVFRGGFQRQAAEQVAGADLLTLSELVDKSLLRRATGGRFDLHELVRQYSAHRLQADPEIETETRDRHGEFFMNLLRAREGELRSGRQKDGLLELNLEMANLRLAWDWAIRRRQILNLRKGTVPLKVYHELRNLFQEGETLFRNALEMMQSGQGLMPEDEPELFGFEVLLGDILAQYAWFSFRLGKIDQSLEMLQRSKDLLAKYNERIVYADVLWYMARACWAAGDFDQAAAAAAESLELNQALGREWQITMVTLCQGGMAHDLGDEAQAEELLRLALARSRQSGDPRLVTMAASYLARTLLSQGDIEGAQALLSEGLSLSAETGDRFSRGLALEGLALAARAAGDGAGACRLLEECIALFREIGDLWSLARALNHLGEAALGDGDANRARACFHEALLIAQRSGAQANTLDALAGLAAWFGHQGQALTAYEATLHILSHPSGGEKRRRKALALQAGLERSLGEEQRQAAAAHAGEVSFDQFVQSLTALWPEAWG